MSFYYYFSHATTILTCELGVPVGYMDESVQLFSKQLDTLIVLENWSTEYPTPVDNIFFSIKNSLLSLVLKNFNLTTYRHTKTRSGLSRVCYLLNICSAVPLHRAGVEKVLNISLWRPNQTTRLTSHANDFVDDKSHAWKKPLLPGY